MVDRCRAVAGGRWDATAKAWTFPAGEVMALHRAIPRSVPRTPTFMILVTGKLEEQADEMVRSQTPDDDLRPVPIEKMPSWGHQKRAFWKARGKPAAMLAMGLGTGKSKVAIDLLQNSSDKRVLILCPKSVVGVWPREFAKHAVNPDWWRCLPLDTGSTVANVARAKVAAGLADVMDSRLVVIVNYESAWRPALAKWLLAQEWDTVICDECHRVKGPQGVASKFVAKLTARAKRRLALSGTPMAHTPLDVFAQYRFLDPQIFGTSYFRFKHRFGQWGGFGGYQLTGLLNEDELNEKFYSIAYRVGEEVLDLPEAVDTQRDVTLSPEGLRAYKQMRDEFVAWVKDGEVVTAVNALGKLLRLQQITSGYLPADDGNPVAIDDAKEKVLAETLEDIAETEPVVVFCRFRADLDAVRRVCEAQGRRYGELSGRSRDGLAADATMSKDIDVLATQIQSGGTGIDLTRARYCIYYSVGFSLSDYLQSRARVHRPGQTRPVTYIHLIAPGTVDETVYQALEARQDAVEAALREVRGT
jgi:SNF2 family DNA or RNA helicase